jgi:hypothetical protein
VGFAIQAIYQQQFVIGIHIKILQRNIVEGQMNHKSIEIEKAKLHCRPRTGYA